MGPCRTQAPVLLWVCAPGRLSLKTPPWRSLHSLYLVKCTSCWLAGAWRAAGALRAQREDQCWARRPLLSWEKEEHGQTGAASSLDLSHCPSEELGRDYSHWVALPPPQAHLSPSCMGSRFSNPLFSATVMGMASSHCEWQAAAQKRRHVYFSLCWSGREKAFCSVLLHPVSWWAYILSKVSDEKKKANTVLQARASTGCWRV